MYLVKLEDINWDGQLLYLEYNYIDRHIRVDLSDDEQFVRNMPWYLLIGI